MGQLLCIKRSFKTVISLKSEKVEKVANNFIPYPGWAAHFTKLEQRVLLKEEEENKLNVAIAQSCPLDEIENWKKTAVIQIDYSSKILK